MRPGAGLYKYNAGTGSRVHEPIHHIFRSFVGQHRKMGCCPLHMIEVLHLFRWYTPTHTHTHKEAILHTTLSHTQTRNIVRCNCVTHDVSHKHSMRSTQHCMYKFAQHCHLQLFYAPLCHSPTLCQNCCLES